jgi:hypothetical protein
MFIGIALSLVAQETSPAATTDANFYLLQEDGTSKIILEDGSGDLKLENSP